MSQIKSSISWLVKLNLFLILPILVGSCGFHSLYDRDDGIIAPEFERIKIDYIPDREGQILKNYLIDNLTPKGKKCCAEYILSVDLTKSEENRAFRRDYTPRQTRLVFIAKINLRDVKSDKVIYTDIFRTTASYTSTTLAEKSAFSAVIADESESNRALRTIADNIKIRLAGFFNKSESEDES